jgi:hypothetical protein
VPYTFELKIGKRTSVGDERTSGGPAGRPEHGGELRSRGVHKHTAASWLAEYSESPRPVDPAVARPSRHLLVPPAEGGADLAPRRRTSTSSLPAAWRGARVRPATRARPRCRPWIRSSAGAQLCTTLPLELFFMYGGL